ncbi:hypothetical protein BV20DRAFT_474870 [Pilatotrama ljubarskyi]|nr:hypothetical protein BV20DRAFT_474870 [Pilatotrama ljubarskyi]
MDTRIDHLRAASTVSLPIGLPRRTTESAKRDRHSPAQPLFPVVRGGRRPFSMPPSFAPVPALPSVVHFAPSFGYVSRIECLYVRLSLNEGMRPRRDTAEYSSPADSGVRLLGVFAIHISFGTGAHH